MRHGKRMIWVTISLSAVLASSSVAAYGSGTANLVFRSSGIRSHGLPTFGVANEVASTTPTVRSPSVTNGDSLADRAWESSRNQPGPERDKKSVGTISTNPITYNGGNLYTGHIAIYPVWVGNWTRDRQQHWNEILGNLITSLPADGAINAPNQIFTTNSLYFSLLNRGIPAPKLAWPMERPSAPITIPGTGIIPVSDDDLANYIGQAIAQGLVPSPDAAMAEGYKPIYVYIGANNTWLSSGFGTQYCGWHSYGDYGTSTVPFIALQDFTSNYLPACAIPNNQVTSPNKDPYADAMANVFAHEVSESMTDPYFDAWYDAYGNENADKCAWTFGQTENGRNQVGTYTYNLEAGDRRYLIQRNWLANNIVKEVVNGVDNACSLTASR